MKYVMLFLLSMFLYSGAFAVSVKITKDNGGCNGYKKVEEEHNANRSTLSCFDPGNEKCVWEYPPKSAAKIARVVSFVEEQIANGFSGGTLSVDGMDVQVVVSNVHLSEGGIWCYTAEFDIQ